MRFVTVPLTNLARRPLRNGLTTIGVGMAVAAFIMMMGLARGMERAWVGSFFERRTDVMAVRKGAIEILSTSLNASVVGMLRRQPEIADATAELVDLVSIESGDSAMIFGWADDSYLWDTVRLREGRKPRPDQPEVVIGDSVASVLGARVGSAIRLIDQEVTVVGISHESGVLIGSALVMPLGSLQRLLNREGQVTDVHLRLARRGEADADRDLISLAARFPALTLTKTEDIASTNQVMGLLRAVSWITSSIGLLMGAVVLVNTLLMSVGERTREIGTLSALGWSRRRVVLMIMLEALVVSSLGGIVGVGAGAMGIQWLARATVVQGFVEPQVSAGLMIETLGAALLLGLAASLYPSWRAASMPTAAALRHE